VSDVADEQTEGREDSKGCPPTKARYCRRLEMKGEMCWANDLYFD